MTVRQGPPLGVKANTIRRKADVPGVVSAEFQTETLPAAATRLRAPASRRYPAAPLGKSGSRVHHDRMRS